MKEPVIDRKMSQLREGSRNRKFGIPRRSQYLRSLSRFIEIRTHHPKCRVGRFGRRFDCRCWESMLNGYGSLIGSWLLCHASSACRWAKRFTSSPEIKKFELLLNFDEHPAFRPKMPSTKPWRDIVTRTFGQFSPLPTLHRVPFDRAYYQFLPWL